MVHVSVPSVQLLVAFNHFFRNGRWRRRDLVRGLGLRLWWPGGKRDLRACEAGEVVYTIFFHKNNRSRKRCVERFDRQTGECKASTCRP